MATSMLLNTLRRRDLTSSSVPAYRSLTRGYAMIRLVFKSPDGKKTSRPYYFEYNNDHLTDDTGVGKESQQKSEGGDGDGTKMETYPANEADLACGSNPNEPTL